MKKTEIISVNHGQVGLIYKKVLVSYDANNNEASREFVSVIETLDKLKKEICDIIDEKSQEIIFRGFSFGGLTFSLSITAQINWSNIPHLPEMLFPLTIQSQDNQTFSLAYADRMNFYLAAVGAKNTPLQQGAGLKGQVNAMITKEDVFAFVDTRQ